MRWFLLWQCFVFVSFCFSGLCLASRSGTMFVAILYPSFKVSFVPILLSIHGLCLLLFLVYQYLVDFLNKFLMFKKKKIYQFLYIFFIQMGLKPKKKRLNSNVSDLIFLLSRSIILYIFLYKWNLSQKRKSN